MKRETRAEHMRWVKERARQEYAFYLERDGEKAAIRCAKDLATG